MTLPNEFDNEVGGVPTDPAVVNGVDETEEEEEEVDGGDIGELT
jgi:hypothetical protein